MRKLQFQCSGSRLSKIPSCNYSGLIRGSKKYLEVSITFDDDWDKMIKVIEFSNLGSHKITPVLLKSDSCMIPDEVTDGKTIQLRIVGKRGDQKIVTNQIDIKQEG